MREFEVQRDVSVGMFGDAKRLTDLKLALVLPRSWPDYWMDQTNVGQRVGEILAATENEVLPWQL